MTDRRRYAIIPTNGRACLKDSIMAIQPQVDRVVLVYTVPYTDEELHADILVRDEQEPKNISRWWNQGLTRVQADLDVVVDHTWDVAIINDDVIVPKGWFGAVSTKMREMRAAAACSGGRTPVSVFHTHAGPVPLSTRMQGFAFMLAGEKRLMFDETLVWWFGDDDMEWRSRINGGVVMLPGLDVEHLHPNGQMTPELQVQAGKDGERFMQIWGQMPW